MIWKKATWLHLRIPFSFFLMPVYCFAASTATVVNWPHLLLSFVAIHLFLYPASNGYNSYFDKDEESIGGLEKPPPVDPELYRAALVWDGMALLLGLWVGWQFALLLLVYGLVSKAYSHPAIRLKRYPLAGWLVVGVFQGAFTFLMVRMALEGANWTDLLQPAYLLPAGLSTALLLGSYPMTQVYQHREDSRRGDRTISLMLGVKGTFWFTACCFLLSGAGYLAYFYYFQTLWHVVLFQVFLLPVMVYFFAWLYRVYQDEKAADFRATMRLNFISALCMNLFFIGSFGWYHLLPLLH